MKVICDVSLIYKMHLLPRRQQFSTLQLHSVCLMLGVRSCLLWLDIIDFKFLEELKLILIVFLLNTFDNMFAFRKLFLHFKSIFPMLVPTFKQKGELNHIIYVYFLLFTSFLICFLLQLFLYIISLSKPPLRSNCYM